MFYSPKHMMWALILAISFTWFISTQMSPQPKERISNVTIRQNNH